MSNVEKTMMTEQTLPEAPEPRLYRVEFTVERRGGPVRKAIEGKNLDKLLARVEKADGYCVDVRAEVTP